MLEELWALCGRRLADDVDAACRCTLSTASASTTARTFDYGGDAEAQCASEVAPHQPRRPAPATSASSQRPRPATGWASRSSARSPSTASATCCAPAPDLVRMRGWRSSTRMVASHMRHPKLRTGLQLPPAADRRQPVHRHRIYSLINALERRYGVHCAMGGTGALVRGLVGAARTARRPPCAATPRCDASWSKAAAPPASSWPTASSIAADIVVSNADTAWTYRHLVEPQHRPHWTDAAHRASSSYSMSLFVWYFGTDSASIPRCRTTRSCWARATRAC